MNGYSIRYRLLMLALLPAFAIALILFGYFTRSQLDLASESLNERGLTIARQLAPASEYGVVTGNSQQLAQLSQALLKQTDIASIIITDSQGVALFSSGTLDSKHLAAPALLDEASLCASYSDRLLFCAPIIKTQLQVTDFPLHEPGAHQVIGTVFVEMSTGSLQRQRSQIIARSLLITAVLLAITGFIAARMGRNISVPIVRMTGTVSKITDGELDLKVYSGATGEIGMLERGIDAMTVSLRAAHDEMQSNIDSATKKLRDALDEVEEKNRDLDKQRIKAQEASEAKSRFLANMSHEIRTPLSGMVGLLYLLRQSHPSHEQREYLDNLESSAGTLRILIDDILDLSRIEAGRLIIHEQEFEIRTLIGTIASMLAPGAHQKGIELIVHIERDVPRFIMGDPMRLRQVLTNLIGNAIKFTERGYVRLYLSCVFEGDTEYQILRFAIEDSGIGIAPQQIDYIFESFAQGDESTTRRYGGSGLGTTISRELVGLMGGVLRVASEQGCGTTFSFTLPMGASDGDTAMWPNASGTPLLLLDAYELSAAAERECFEALGYRVSAVNSEEELLAAVEANPDHFEVIVLSENSRYSKWQTLPSRLRNSAHLNKDARFVHLTFYDSDDDPLLFDITQHKPADGQSLHEGLEELAANSELVHSPTEVQQEANDRALAILLAEDDPINAKVMSYFLQQKGHRVTHATNGRVALELLDRQTFDMAFLDMRMPEADGLMVARQWRGQEGEGEHLPLIAVTANATREDREACFAAGMDDFVSKPVDQEQLSELLSRYVQKLTAT